METHEQDARQTSTEESLFNNSPSLFWNRFGAETMIGKLEQSEQSGVSAGVGNHFESAQGAE